MLKVIYSIGAAAIVAGTFVATLSLTDAVQAHGSNPAMRTDRADLRPIGENCSQHAWPYYESACLRDARNPFGVARTVRLVSTDRVR